MIGVLAIIFGGLAVVFFVALRRKGLAASTFGMWLAVILALISLCLWTASMGFERAISIWIVQIISCGIVLSSGFAITDVLRYKATRSKK